MLAFLYYCIKVIICSGILYGYYLMVLRNNRFHQWNRWYLLASVGLSFLLPLLKIPLPNFFEDKPALVYGAEILAAPDFYFAAHQPQRFHFTLESASLAAYILFSICLLFFFFKNIRKIQLLKHQYQDETANGIHFYYTAEPGTPFSFFKNIFWNTDIDLQTDKGQQMLRHEMAHVTELHSVDKVLMQVLLSFAFWNPFLYFIKKEIAIVHEFIADQKALAGDDKLQYASLLLMKAMGSQQFPLGNPFFHSQLKRRLTMLTTSKNPRFSYMRRLLVLPLAAISIVLFSFKYKEIKEKEKTFTLAQNTTNEEEYYSDSSKPKLYVRLNKMYQGSSIESIVPAADMSGAIVKTANGKEYFLNRATATQELDFTVTDSGFIAPPGSTLVTGKEKMVVRKGAFIQVSPHSRFPQYEYTIDTTAIGLSRAVPSIMLQGEKISIDENQDIHVPDGPIKINISGAPGGLEKALIILDGIEMDFTKLKDLDVKTFKSMDIFKSENAIAKYGEKGKNGVIIITTKEKEHLPDNVLYVLNGNESTKEIVNALEQAKIKSVNVLKGESATAKYGNKGQNGAIEITTENTTTPTWINSNTLYIMDGKEVSFAYITNLHLIEKGLLASYSEMAPTGAKKVYGEKGRNGAVIFTTKKYPTEKIVIGHKLVKNEVTFDEETREGKMPERLVIGQRINTDSAASKTGTATTLAKQPTQLKDVVVVGYEKKPEYEKVFTKVDNPASFPGGLDGWRRYLERNLQYPNAAQEKGTQGTVRVQMVVNEDGNITELKALNDPGNGLAEEAVRVISKGPKWIPATQNGHLVTYRFVQNLTFQLQ